MDRQFSSFTIEGDEFISMGDPLDLGPDFDATQTELLPPFQLSLDIITGTICAISIGNSPDVEASQSYLSKGFVNACSAKDVSGTKLKAWIIDSILIGKIDTKSVPHLPATIQLDEDAGTFIELFIEQVDPSPVQKNVIDLLGRIVSRSHDSSWVDPLTGLANVSQVINHITELVRSDELLEICTLIIDIDGFSAINENYSISYGDQILKSIAARLQGSFGAKGFLGRLFSDVFVLIITGINSDETATWLGRSVQTCLAGPFKVDEDDEPVLLTASIGVARVSTDSEPTADEILSMSSKARSVAKRSGPGGIELYQGINYLANLRVQTDKALLREAISGGQISLLYLPIYELADMRMVAVEALARWDHPEKGQLGAGMFAPLAEEMGLGRELARIVLEQAINQSVHWWNRFPGLDIRIDVNVSESYLKDSALAFELIHMLESRSGEHLPIWLDISVGGLTGRSWGRSEAQLHALSEYGIGLNLDNLGEDGAGLSVLTKFSFDQVKFAKSMIELVDTSEVARKVILSTTDLVRTLGTSVCAIGVENADQLKFLKDIGIDSVAGYQLARPISAEGLEMVFSLSGNQPPDQAD